MLRIALFSFLFTLSLTGTSQTTVRIEEFKTELHHAKTSEQKGFYSAEIAELYHDIDLDSVFHYAKLAIRYGQDSKNNSILASGFHNKAVGLRKKGEVEAAVNLFYEALKLRENTTEYDKISSSYLSLGNINFDQGTLEAEKEQYESSDKNFAKCLEYYETGLDFALKSGDSIQISKSYENLGSAHFNIYKPKLEFEYDYEKAIEHYNLSYNYYPANERDWVYAELKTSILSCKFEMNDLESLEEDYLDILQCVKRNNQKEQWIDLNIAYSAGLWGSQPRRAMEYLKEADSLAGVLKNKVSQIKVNQLFYERYKELGNYAKALHHYEVYSSLETQISNTKTKAEIEKLDLKYNNEKKQRQIIQERAKTNAEKTEKSFFKWSLFGVILFLVAAFAFFIQRLYIQRLRRKREQEEHNQEVNSLLINQELKTMEAMLDGQESERKRIAEDLHDRLGSTLSAAKMYFEATLPTPENIPAPQQSKAYELLDQAIQDTREISHNLVSGALSKFGLAVALRDLKATIEGASDVSVHLEIDVADERFERDIEIQIYRIVQELWSNSLKHSKPTKLGVTLLQNEQRVELTVSDNGSGYDPQSSSSGMGLNNIEGRVSKLEGSIEVLSNKKSGTINTIIFNLRNDD